MPRTQLEIVYARMTSAEKRAITAAAKTMGLSVTRFVVDSALRRAISLGHDSDDYCTKKVHSE